MVKANLVRCLIDRARREHNVLYLGMALRLHYPKWGSQSVLVAQSVATYLDHLRWNVSRMEEELFDWMQAVKPFYGPELMALRLTQIRHVAEMAQDPADVVLEPADNTEQSKLLTQVANLGMLFEDLLAAPDDHPSKLVRDACQILHQQKFTVHDYIHAVHPAQQLHHPNALQQAFMGYLVKLSAVQANYAPVYPSVMSLQSAPGKKSLLA